MAGSRIQDIILRDTRANQPLASSVSIGALYYVTDEQVTEYSDGSSWLDYSDAGSAGSGIDQLTGDVTAGPGSGSQAATIANNAVTTLKILNAAVTLAKIANIATARFLGRISALSGVIEELTGTQATSMLDNFVGDSGAGGTKGLVPAPSAGDAAADKFLHADGTWQVPGGGGAVLRAITISVNDAAMAVGVVGEQTYVYNSGEIIGWYILADAAGDVEFDIEKTTFASYPASFSSIVASAPPELVGVDKDSDTTLTGWTTAVDQFDVIRATLVTADPGITRLNLVLVIQED